MHDCHLYTRSIDKEICHESIWGYWAKTASAQLVQDMALKAYYVT